MVDLSATYAGTRLKNFLISAAGPNTHTPEVCERNAKAGFAAVVLKTGTADLPEYRRCKVGSPMVKLLDPLGHHPWRPLPPKKSAPKVRGKKGRVNPDYCVSHVFQTSPFYSSMDPEYIEYYTEAYKRCEPYDCKVIPSIDAHSWSGWEKQVKMVNKMKPRPIAVELNTAATIIAVITEPIEGLLPGMCPAAEPDVLEKVVKFCVDRLDVPVVSKFPPFEMRSTYSALAAQQAGAKGINLGDAGSVPSISINIETATPGDDPSHPGYGLAGWGPAAIPVNCSSIWQMRKKRVTIDIAATGGIREPEHIIKYIMAGASCVEVCSVVWVEGFDVATRLLDGVASFMERKGYKSIEDMKGIIVDKMVTDASRLEQRIPLRAGGAPPPKEVVVDEKKCIDCGWCEAGCMFLAIETVDQFPRIDRRKCETCGMCVELCPVRALSFRQASSA